MKKYYITPKGRKYLNEALPLIPLAGAALKAAVGFGGRFLAGTALRQGLRGLAGTVAKQGVRGLAGTVAKQGLRGLAATGVKTAAMAPVKLAVGGARRVGQGVKRVANSVGGGEGNAEPVAEGSRSYRRLAIKASKGAPGAKASLRRKRSDSGKRLQLTLQGKTPHKREKNIAADIAADVSDRSEVERNKEPDLDKMMTALKSSHRAASRSFGTNKHSHLPGRISTADGLSQVDGSLATRIKGIVDAKKRARNFEQN